jgi:hypothetical protein
MALDRPRDTPVRGAHAPRIGTREPCASAATRRVEGAPAAAATDGGGPNVLGSIIATVEELAAFPAGGAARDRGRLAQVWIPTLLGVEESTATRSARHQYGGERSDSADEPGQSSWGAPRIHGELLKLGVTVSQATVSKYMLRPRRPPSQAWRTFLKNHAKELIALDFFTVPTATFRVLFVLVMLTPSRRRLVHFNVTEHPTAEWTARQLLEACAREEGPRYLIRDRDQVYGERFSRQTRMLDIREVVIGPRSPWQNAYAERVM